MQPAYTWLQPLGGFTTFFCVFLYACYHGQHYEDIVSRTMFFNIHFGHAKTGNKHAIILCGLIRKMKFAATSKYLSISEYGVSCSSGKSGMVSLESRQYENSAANNKCGWKSS